MLISKVRYVHHRECNTARLNVREIILQQATLESGSFSNLILESPFWTV